MKEQNIHSGHRQRLREIIHKNGITSLNDVNYLEALLSFAIPRADTNQIAHNLLEEFKSIDSIFNADYSQLKQVNGVGEHTADLLALVGVSNYYVQKAKLGAHPIINSLNSSISFIRAVLPPSQNEQFIAIALRKNLAVESYKVFKGVSHSKVSIDVSELTNFLLSHPTGFYMFAHTHPYHNANPSDSDFKQFENLAIIANSLSFQVVDNLVLGDDELFSFKFLKKYKYNEIDIDYSKNKITNTKQEPQTNSANSSFNDNKNITKEPYAKLNNHAKDKPFMQEQIPEQNINSGNISASQNKVDTQNNNYQSNSNNKTNFATDDDVIFAPVDDASGKVNKDAIKNQNQFTMEEFKKIYKEKPHFTSIEQQRAWIKKYSEDFVRASNNEKQLKNS